MPLTRHNDVLRSRAPAVAAKKTVVVGLDVKSLILLLNTNANDVLEQNLLYLNQISHEEDAMTILDSETVVKRLLEILSILDKSCLRKLCLRLISTLVQTDSAKKVFCSNVCYMQLFIDALKSAKDSTTIELCLYIISNLTIDRQYGNHLLHLCNILSILKKEILHNDDLDIQYNCVKTLENLLMHDLIETQSDIPVVKIFEIFRHRKIERLQASSLNILYKLTEEEDPLKEYGKKLLTLFGSFAEAFDLVNVWPYEDQKIILLYLIAELPLENIDIMALKKLLKLLDNASSALRTAGMNVLVRLCSNELCQYYLDTLDIPQLLMNQMMGDDPGVSQVVCQGIRILCERNPDFLNKISTDTAILGYILKMIAEKSIGACYKAYFGELLLVMMQNVESCKTVAGVEDKGSRSNVTVNVKAAKTSILLDVAIQSEDEELTCVILKCLLKLVSSLPSHQCIGQEEIETIIQYFGFSSAKDERKTETFLQILSFCLTKPAFAKSFINLQGLPIIDDYMRQVSGRLLLSYGSFLIHACKSDLAQVINSLHIFHWMNKHHFQEPLWHRTIRSLLNINLSLKFAFCNSLGFFDRISEGFYAFKRRKHVDFSWFPDLDEINEQDSDKVVYVFTRDQNVQYKDSNIEKYISDILVFLRSTSLHDPFRTSNSSDLNFNNKILKTNTKPDLEMLASYVVNQMNGFENDADEFKNNEHLKDLVAQQNSNVIPIGHVKIGLKFERCLLFKILCDLLGYPCKMVRSEYDDDCLCQVIARFAESVEDLTGTRDDLRRQVLTVDLMSNPPLLSPVIM